jgi:hypothetical protein
MVDKNGDVVRVGDRVRCDPLDEPVRRAMLRKVLAFASCGVIVRVGHLDEIWHSDVITLVKQAA